MDKQREKEVREKYSQMLERDEFYHHDAMIEFLKDMFEYDDVESFEDACGDAITEAVLKIGEKFEIR